MTKRFFLTVALSCLLLAGCQTAGKTTPGSSALTPTGYASEEVQRISLFYDGSLYLYLYHATGFDLPKEESWELLGQVASVNNLEWPTEDLCGTHLNAGQEVYRDPADPKALYVKYDSGFALLEAEETEAEETTRSEELTSSPVQTGIKFCTTTELELKLTNTGSETVGYGEAYTLEVLHNDSWEPLPVLPENYGFHDIGYELEPGGSLFLDIEFEWLYGELPPGRYRIVKEFFGSNEESFWVTAEFELS